MPGQIDEEDRKLFVGGLPQECTQEDLNEYFGKYGELERVQLKMDPTTGRSRGFAFVLFADVSGLEAATVEDHSIKGKKSTVKKADVKAGKIYLGRLPEQGVTDDDIRNHFSEYGVVTEVIRPIDKMKNNEPKNFCFITFEKDRISKKLIQQGTAMVNGHKLMIKEVTPNPRDPSARGGGGMRGGARGGGYGGGWDQSAAYGGGYGGGAWGGDQSGGYGGGAWGGADQSGGYGGYGAAAGGYGEAAGGYGAAAGGYGGGYGGGQMGGGKMMRGGGGGRGGAMGGRGGPRGRGRGAPY